VKGKNNAGDITITWARCSRIPGIHEDNWTTQFWNSPLDCTEERYELDVLNSSGTAIRTYSASGVSRVTYSLADQVLDFTAAQSAYNVKVYQVDPVLGRGRPRSATLTVLSLPRSA
jgi:hypothetical protein